MKICIACNAKSEQVESPLEGDALDMFNFVCCLSAEPEDTKGICVTCNEELTVSFNFKKRCLEIFANVYQHSNELSNDFDCTENLMELDHSTFHEDENSLNLNDLLIPEICLGNENAALNVLDVSDSSKCRYCFVGFSSKEECVGHMESHKGDEKPYKCPQDGCDSSFKARKNLKDHYLVHSNERPFKCHFCSQTFKSSSNRSKHERRIHPVERNAMRKMNDEHQHNKSIEKVHVVKVKQEPELPPPTPTLVLENSFEERVFQCDYEGCTSNFKSRSSLRDHLKVHSDDRPFKCGFCTSSFKSSSNRSKHERGSHTTQYEKRKLQRERQKRGEVVEGPPEPKKPKLSQAAQQIPKVIQFQCRYCDRNFKNSASRERHEGTHKDNNAFDCGFCSKNFKTQEELREHKKVHTSTTRGSKGSTAGGVDDDRLSMRETSQPSVVSEFFCEEIDCGKVYASKKALKIHRTMKHSNSNNDDAGGEISCEICSITFRKSELENHMKIHI